MPRFLLAIIGVLLLAGCVSHEPVVLLPDGSRITVEVAWSAAEQQKGLMYRESLAENRGMLFPYNREGARTFWMKNTLIPLDIIFLDQHGTVINVANAVPCKDGTECALYSSTAPAQYVFEIPGGQADRHGLKAGDSLTLQNILGKALPTEQ